MTGKRASELLSENLTRIYGYAFSKLYDKDQVDDLTSEIVYEVMRSVNNLQNDGAFWGFVWKIAENTFRRFLRDGSRRLREVALTEDSAYGLSPEEEYISRETESEEIFLLRRELSLLKKTHREVCVAYYVGNKTCSQIARELHLSEDTVKYHLFKTRKLLKEGIGMTRTFGEKSYNPGTFRLDFWGDSNKYGSLFQRKMPGAIVLAAYYEPMTAEALSMELGVSMPYLEEELEALHAAGALKKTGERFQTNLVILTDDYEKEFVRDTAPIYPRVASSVFEKTLGLLPQIRRLPFHGSDYDDNRLLFGILNLAFMRGYEAAKGISPIGEPRALPLGGHGWIFGYDNDYAHHHFSGMTLQTWNKSATAWFSSENYRAIASAQLYDHSDFRRKAEAIGAAILGQRADWENPTLPWLIENRFIFCRDGVLSANFPVFDRSVYEEICFLLKEVTSEVAACMIEISDKAEKILSEHAPAPLKEQCGDVAKIHHRLDVAAFLLEELMKEQKLTVPAEKTPLCMWGVSGLRAK